LVEDYAIIGNGVFDVEGAVADGWPLTNKALLIEILDKDVFCENDIIGDKGRCESG
jgi:hypothetical protein